MAASASLALGESVGVVHSLSIQDMNPSTKDIHLVVRSSVFKKYQFSVSWSHHPSRVYLPLVAYTFLERQVYCPACCLSSYKVKWLNEGHDIFLDSMQTYKGGLAEMAGLPLYHLSCVRLPLNLRTEMYPYIVLSSLQ